MIGRLVFKASLINTSEKLIYKTPSRWDMTWQAKEKKSLNINNISWGVEFFPIRTLEQNEFKIN